MVGRDDHGAPELTPAFEGFAVRYATFTSRRSDMFHRYAIYGEPDAPIQTDYFFWVLRSGAGTILIDTGFETKAGERRGRRTLIDPVESLGELGIEPGEVTDIVVSHCHYDHIGNLNRFPQATLTVERRELDFWTGPYAGRLQFRVVAETEEIDYLVSARESGRVRILDGRCELTPGVALALVGGHCPGQLIVLVGDGPKRTVLASDSLHFYEEMERDMPFAIFSDLAGMYQAYETLRDLERDGAKIVAGHDPLVMERFPIVTGTGSTIAVRVY